jgi:hypothetical protein
MITAAIAIYLLFGLLTIAGRAWIQYRRTGDHGFRGLSGPTHLIEVHGDRYFAYARRVGRFVPGIGCLTP